MKKLNKRFDINYDYNVNKFIILNLQELKIIVTNENIDFDITNETITSGAYGDLQQDIEKLLDNSKYSNLLLNMENLYINKSNDNIKLNLNIYKEIKCENIEHFKEKIKDITNQYYSNEELINNCFNCEELKDMLTKEFYTKDDYRKIEERYKIKLDTGRYLVVGIKEEKEEDEVLWERKL